MIYFVVVPAKYTDYMEYFFIIVFADKVAISLLNHVYFKLQYKSISELNFPY